MFVHTALFKENKQKRFYQLKPKVYSQILITIIQKQKKNSCQIQDFELAYVYPFN